MKTITKWVSALAFDATDENGHTVRIDTTTEGGGLGSGMNPKKMLLASLSGCSAMDVVEMLTKMRVKFTRLEVEAEAEQTTEHPKVFKFVNMVYRADISGDDLDKLKKAATLSHDKYCGVSAMLSKHCEITFSVESL